MQVWERLLLIHLLRCFERRGWLDQINRLAFFLDGPLGVFGPPAWLSAAISTELKRLNAAVRAKTGNDLLSSGSRRPEPSSPTSTRSTRPRRATPASRRGPTCCRPTSTSRSGSSSPTAQSATASIPTSGGSSSTRRRAAPGSWRASRSSRTRRTRSTSDDVSLYPQFPTVCASRQACLVPLPNALSPLVSAHAHAAIPLQLGAKVLQQLARALMRKD